MRHPLVHYPVHYGKGFGLWRQYVRQMEDYIKLLKSAGQEL